MTAIKTDLWNEMTKGKGFGNEIFENKTFRNPFISLSTGEFKRKMIKPSPLRPFIVDSEGEWVEPHRIDLHEGKNVLVEGHWYKVVYVNDRSITLEPCAIPLIGEQNEIS